MPIIDDCKVVYKEDDYRMGNAVADLQPVLYLTWFGLAWVAVNFILKTNSNFNISNKCTCSTNKWFDPLNLIFVT